MKYDIILSGVGGQGVLSIAFVVDNAAMKQGYHIKQSELHGMAQRGGAVRSQLRISEKVIYSDLIRLKTADMIIAVEPMEALRCRDYLGDDGIMVASTSPVVNIPDYPDRVDILTELTQLKRLVLLNGDRIARGAGSGRASNMVMLGAASPYLPLERGSMTEYIGKCFITKGDRIIGLNLNAFEKGLNNSVFFTECLRRGCDPLKVTG